MSTLNLDRRRRELHLYELAMLSGGADLAIATAGSAAARGGRLNAWADGTLRPSASSATARTRSNARCTRPCATSGRRPAPRCAPARRRPLRSRSLTRDLTAVRAARDGAARDVRPAPAARHARGTPSSPTELRSAQPRAALPAGHGREAARATALFGGGALWLVEPELAVAVGVPREAGRAVVRPWQRRRRLGLLGMEAPDSAAAGSAATPAAATATAAAAAAAAVAAGAAAVADAAEEGDHVHSEPMGG